MRIIILQHNYIRKIFALLIVAILFVLVDINYITADDSTKFFCPIDSGRVVSTFGYHLHPIFRKYRQHNGIDIETAKGSPVYATSDGKIILAYNNGGYGKTVIISHPDGYESRYGHLNEIKVIDGQEVSKGDIIGTVGNTGLTTSFKLYFEIRKNEEPIDPLIMIDINF